MFANVSYHVHKMGSENNCSIRHFYKKSEVKG